MKIPIQFVDIDIEGALKIAEKNNIYAYVNYIWNSIFHTIPMVSKA